MADTPSQRGGVTLPQDFAEVLAAMKQARDPRLPVTLQAAREAGWNLDPLAHALGVTRERVRQIIKKGDTTADVDPETLPEVPAVPEVGPRKPTARPPAIELTAEEADQLRKAPAAASASHAETIKQILDAGREREETARAERAERERRVKVEQAAARKFLALCKRRFLVPLKGAVDAEHDGQRWYRCAKCRKKLLRDAVNPYAHRCF